MVTFTFVFNLQSFSGNCKLCAWIFFCVLVCRLLPGLTSGGQIEWAISYISTPARNNGREFDEWLIRASAGQWPCSRESWPSEKLEAPPAGWVADYFAGGPIPPARSAAWRDKFPIATYALCMCCKWCSESCTDHTGSYTEPISQLSDHPLLLHAHAWYNHQ